MRDRPHPLPSVYPLDPLRCPGCDGTLRILAFLTDPPVLEGILRHLGLPHRTPRIAPARAPPQDEIDFDQSLQGDDGTWSA